jgi:hypothetical protein
MNDPMMEHQKVLVTLFVFLLLVSLVQPLLRALFGVLSQG